MANMNPSQSSDVESELGQEKMDPSPPDTSPERASLDVAKEEASASSPPDPVPNGGLTAWLQVLGSFFLFLKLLVSSNPSLFYHTVTIIHSSSADHCLYTVICPNQLTTTPYSSMA